MAFNYDLASTDTDIKTVSRLRVVLGDMVEDRGILARGRNFQDDELLQFYADENSHRTRAVAAALEAAANAWAAHASTYRLGPESDASRQADTFRQRAMDLRQQVGYTADGDGDAAGFAVPVKPAGQV